jgi:hypothetical protein
VNEPINASIVFFTKLSPSFGNLPSISSEKTTGTNSFSSIGRASWAQRRQCRVASISAHCSGEGGWWGREERDWEREVTKKESMSRRRT